MLADYSGRKIGLTHLTYKTASLAEKYAQKCLPGIETIHIVDEIMKLENFSAVIGTIPKTNYLKYSNYMKELEGAGCEAIVSCCSFMGEPIKFCRNVVNIPIISIEGPAIENAVAFGNVIGLVTTTRYLPPFTERVTMEYAITIGKKLRIETILDEKAYNLFYQGDIKGHNRIILDHIAELESKVDCVMLTQGPHAALEEDIEKANFKIPVFCPGTSTFNRVKELIK